MLKTYVCTKCGKTFERSTRQGTGKTPYCSRACSFADRIGKPLLNRMRRYTRICPVCKKEFEAGGQYKSKHTICCSCESAGMLRPHNKRQECNVISPTDAAYIAGFLDGEGCIALIGRKSGGNSLRVSFAQCEKGKVVFEKIKTVAGIQSNIVYKKHTNNKHAVSMTLACHGSVAEGLLRQLLPYLIIKKPQAELVLDYQSKLDFPEWRANLAWHKECNEKMHELNKRGTDAQE